MQGFLSICKLTNVIHHIKKIGKERPYDHLNRGRESFQQNSTHILIDTLQKMHIEGTHFKIIKTIYNRHTANNS